MKSFLLAIFVSLVLVGTAFSKGLDVNVEQKTVQLEAESQRNEADKQAAVSTSESNELVLFVLFVLLPVFYCLIRTNGKHA